MDQQIPPATLPARDELRAQFFSPAAKARREAALRLPLAERSRAFREAAREWAVTLAPGAVEHEVQEHVERLVACCHQQLLGVSA